MLFSLVCVFPKLKKITVYFIFEEHAEESSSSNSSSGSTATAATSAARRCCCYAILIMCPCFVLPSCAVSPWSWELCMHPPTKNCCCVVPPIAHFKKTRGWNFAVYSPNKHERPVPLPSPLLLMLLLQLYCCCCAAVVVLVSSFGSALCCDGADSP